jgi:hypothetical protein
MHAQQELPVSRRFLPVEWLKKAYNKLPGRDLLIAFSYTLRIQLIYLHDTLVFCKTTHNYLFFNIMYKIIAQVCMHILNLSR